MLRHLHIRNYVLIDSLDISFPEGLVIITGQTGAGKSILLGALSLLTGAKADASVIGDGADNCVVEGEFSIGDEAGTVRALMEEGEVDWDGGRLIIRRVVNASGRSRSFINDSPVPVTLLSEIASGLVDIHSQHRTLALAGHAFQMSVLDHYAGNGELLEACRTLWKDILSARAALAEAGRRLERLASEREYNEAQYLQLERAALKDGELEDLEDEQKRLANAGEIKGNLEAAGYLFAPDEGMSVDASLKEARRMIERTVRFMPDLASLADRIESARIELGDISEEIGSRASSVDMSEGRLQQVEDRLSLLYGLMKKHSCNTVAELIAVRDRFGDAVYDGDSLAGSIASMTSALEVKEAAHRDLCSRISAARHKAAPALAAGIQSSLRGLEIDRAVFGVLLTPSEPGAEGSDDVSFVFSSTGAEPMDISKCASGGELSRIMLCLKAVMAHYSGMPTMVFDEIDSGVSGSVADRMGAMICSMGRDMQVFAITHLPQVAAKGEAHYLVSKETDVLGRTTSSIKKIDGDSRVMEIARLLSGSSITREAVANARSLLAQ